MELKTLWPEIASDLKKEVDCILMKAPNTLPLRVEQNN